MAFAFQNLDTKTRQLMLNEIEYDIKKDNLYISPRLNEQGVTKYPELLRKAILDGSEVTLAESLIINVCIKETEQRRKPKGGFTNVKVPVNANLILAEG